MPDISWGTEIPVTLVQFDEKLKSREFFLFLYREISYSSSHMEINNLLSEDVIT